MQTNAMTSFARQPWFLPVAVLIVIILWLQLSPSTGGRGGDGVGVGLGDSISHEQVKSLITSEIRSALIDTVKTTSTDGTKFPPVKVLPDSQRLRILVTGGSGFVGSHLVDRLMMQGHHVIVLDNMFTGRKKNIAQWVGHPNFQLIIHDVVERIMLEVDQIYHLACPASPPHYQYNPIKTIKTSTEGTLNMLGLAKRSKARMLLTSTSEVYGDPEVHPQKETYWGNVNPIGPRACYDEGKRVAETMMYAYESQAAVEVRVARIFNTFGPRMHPNDGRVVSNFIIQALQGKDITIYGNGKQTRSFQYVDDLVEGLMRLMNGNYSLPVNLGNPEEYTVKVRERLPLVVLLSSLAPP
jgi:UDP-glucuronate decarboxylase